MRLRNTGQALLEFALVLGIVLLLVLGAISALQMLLAQYSAAQAARTAAQQAALLGSVDGPQGVVMQQASLVLNSGFGTHAEAAQINFRCVAPCRRYSPLQVRVDYRAALWAPIGPLRELRVSAGSVRALERDGSGGPIDLSYAGIADRP